MSTYEIADELKVQADTVVWLLLHGKDGVKTRDAYDVYVNWNPIGSSVRRLTLVGRAMADIVREAVEQERVEGNRGGGGLGAGGVGRGRTGAPPLGESLDPRSPPQVEEREP